MVAEITGFVADKVIEEETYDFTSGNGTYYIGTYGTYTTLSMSKISYAKTSMPSHFYTPNAQELTSITVSAEGGKLEVEEGKTLQMVATPNAGAELGAVTWSVDDDSKATIDASTGVLTGVAAGDVEVTATSGLISGKATVTVKEASGGGDPVETATVEILPSHGTAGENTDYTITKDGYSAAVTASTLTAEQIRVFKGKTITISGSKIVKIVFTCTANGTAKYGPGSFGAGAPAGYTFEAAGATGTWEGDATSSVTFTATDNQVRITSIVITYEVA